MGHQSANESDVQDYANDMVDGPNPEDLHFDMTTGPDSVWNRRVLELLLEKLKEEDGDMLPARSDAYWIDLLAKRFINLWTPWNKGQRKMKPSGELETPEEVEDRLSTSVAMDEVRSRKATRRNHVSSKIFKIIKYNTYPQPQDISCSPTHSQLYNPDQGRRRGERCCTVEMVARTSYSAQGRGDELRRKRHR